jgi:hypothetical protein
MHNVELESPIFGLYTIGNYLIICSGGGNKKFGVKNKILLYNLTSKGLSSKHLYEKIIDDDIPTFITGINKKNIFVTCMNGSAYFYKISKDKFDEIYKLDVIEEYNDELFLNCIYIDEKTGDMITGTSNGILTHFKITFHNNDNNMLSKIDNISENTKAHLKTINNLNIIKNGKNKYAVTASSDGNCKIFDLNDNLRFISKFSFRQFEGETANYIMRDILYDNFNNLIYTLQSPYQGKSFITKWSFTNINEIRPIETIELIKSVCFSMYFNSNKNVIGIINSEGNILFVNPYEMSLIGQKTVGENTIKCGVFWEKYFIVGSVDNFVRMNKIKSNFGFFKFIKFLLFLLIIAFISYDIYIKTKNKKVI